MIPTPRSRPEASRAIITSLGSICILLSSAVAGRGWSFTVASMTGDSEKDIAGQVSRILDDINRQRTIKQKAAAAEPIKALGKKAVPSLVQVLKESKDVNRRFCALVALDRLGMEAREAVPTLFDLINDKQEFVLLRASAMGALRSLRPPWKDHLPFLGSALNDVALTRQAKEVLEELGPAAQPLVPDLLKLIKENGPRSQYVAILGAIGPGAKDAIPVLLEALKKGKNATEKGGVARALGKIGPQNKEVVAELLQALKADASELRWSAADALGDLGPVNEDVLRSLRVALMDHAAPVRSSALRAIGKLGKKAEKALPDIIAIFNNSKHFDLIRDVAVEAMGRIGLPTPPVIDTLKTALKDPDRIVRLAAVKSIWILSEQKETNVPVLIEIVNDAGVGKELTRAEAMQLLGEMGPKAKSAVPALLNALRDDYHYIREVAAEQLKKIDPGAAKKAGIK